MSPCPFCGGGKLSRADMESAPTHRDGACVDSESPCCRGRTMPAPCNPHQKNQPPAQASYLGGRLFILILLHQPTHQLCIGNGVLNGQTGDQQGLVIEQLGVLGDLVGVARGVGGLQGGKDRVVRVQLQHLRALDAPLRWACGAVPSPSPSRYRPRQTG